MHLRRFRRRNSRIRYTEDKQNKNCPGVASFGEGDATFVCHMEYGRIADIDCANGDASPVYRMMVILCKDIFL